MNIPNGLTLLRILLIPVVAACLFLPESWGRPLSAMLFGLAAVTDWLDGYIARKFDQQSALGAFLDPVADKLAVALVLILLLSLHPGVAMTLPVSVIIGREITVSALREWMASISQGQRLAVSLAGKVKTVSQMVAILCLLYQHDFFFVPMFQLGLVLLYISAFLTLLSMILYLRRAFSQGLP